VIQQQIKEFTLLPPAPGLCPECAVGHEPHEPHDQTSLFYQMKFNMEHDRYPTWVDAMGHCSDEMKAAWTEELKKRGVWNVR